MALEQYNFGAGTLTAVRTDIAVPQPRVLGTLQDISVKMKFKATGLYGQYQDPVAVGRGSRTIDLGAKFAKIQAAALNDLFVGGTTTTGEAVQVINEGGTGITLTTVTLNTNAVTNTGATLPFASTTGVVIGQSVTGTNIAANSYVVSFTGTSVTLNQAISGTVASGAAIVFGPTYVVANPSSFQQDLGVFNALTGAQLTYVASAPAAGQYSVNTSTGAYFFSAADAASGVTVLVSYRYNQTVSGSRITAYNQLMGSATFYQLNLTNQFGGNGLNLFFYKTVSTDWNFDFKNEDFTVNDVSFMPMADPIGRVFDWSTNQ